MIRLEVRGENDNMLMVFSWEDVKKAIKDSFKKNKNIDSALDEVRESIVRKLRRR